MHVTYNRIAADAVTFELFSKHVIQETKMGAKSAQIFKSSYEFWYEEIGKYC